MHYAKKRLVIQEKNLMNSNRREDMEKTLYYGYALVSDNTPFKFEVGEIPIVKIADDGTIETKRKFFYGVFDSDNKINGSSKVKTETEYSTSDSCIYFSMDYQKCMNYIVQKKEKIWRGFRDTVNRINKLEEKLLNSEIKNNTGHNTYSLWMEGFSATGQHNTAQYLGDFEGNSFNDACDNWANSIEEQEYYKSGNDKCRPTYWGCRIFDNEEDARKSFG